MIQGTSSGVGKTILTIALCRIFKQDGYSVAPFKSQNMTNNTAIIGSGEEIAVSQILQAYAADVAPSAKMNPIVLKPLLDRQGTQLISNGRSCGVINAYNFKEIKKKLIPEIQNAYQLLASQYDIIVIEGAGSPVELNMSGDDIVNMGIAKLAHAPVLLVGDISRGGIFASLYGTVSLLDYKKYVQAMVVNRFKGDLAWFAGGKVILEKITGLPVAGIVPYMAFDLPEEDDLDTRGMQPFVSGGNYDCQIDFIAEVVRKSLNMELIYQILNQGIEA